MAEKSVVLSGATYAGKTTLLRLFQAQGYTVVPEAGGLVIAELNSKLSVEGQKKWRAENPLAFYELLIAKQQELEAAVKPSAPGLTFYDRAVPDYLAFLRLAKVEIPDRLRQIACMHQYDLVFVCEILSGFDDRSSTGRSLGRGDSEKLQELTMKTYEEFCCPAKLLKAAPIEERIAFILAALSS
ncbi:MAG: hypothetical protein C5B53_12395 [Candidatus Melainabacteria bacterium]|nr:MAG: hypothetical protein C5B53_12395 [Candidatus Melainabacteria bacterium]